MLPKHQKILTAILNAEPCYRIALKSIDPAKIPAVLTTLHIPNILTLGRRDERNKMSA